MGLKYMFFFYKNTIIDFLTELVFYAGKITSKNKGDYRT